MWDSKVAKVLGDQVIQSIQVKKISSSELMILYDVTGLFVAIGHWPNTELFKELLTVDDVGYI